MKFLNKDSQTVQHFDSYTELFEAAQEFFSGMDYTASSNDESKNVEGGKVYCVHAIEDPATDHFFGFVADDEE